MVTKIRTYFLYMCQNIYFISICFRNKLKMKPEQERVRHLLSDTVTLLCKNGLQFQDELRVEGVIGITLDNNEVFVVHINEAFGEGGVQKRPPKNLGSGSIGATTLSDLPGLVSEQQVQPRMAHPRGIIRGRGVMRSRPFNSTMRRGTFNSIRRPTNRGMRGVTRGRGMSMNRHPPSQHVVVLPHTTTQQPQPQNIPESPEKVVKIEVIDDDVLASCSSEMSNLVKDETNVHTNGQLLNKTGDHTSSSNGNSFVNLSLGDMTADNLPFFDPLNDNENSSMEPPAKRSHTDSEPNLTSPLDSIMNVVSTNVSGMTSPQSTLHTSLSNQHDMLPEIKQESFPPSLQPMGGPSEWQLNSIMNSPQKSPHGMIGGPAASNTADTVSVWIITSQSIQSY